MVPIHTGPLSSRAGSKLTFAVASNARTPHFDDVVAFNRPSYRQIVNLADVEASLFLNPLGQNGNQLQPNYDDLLPLWSNGEYMAMKTRGYPVKDQLDLSQS